MSIAVRKSCPRLRDLTTEVLARPASHDRGDTRLGEADHFSLSTRLQFAKCWPSGAGWVEMSTVTSLS